MHKKPRQWRSTAAARQREQDYGSGEPSRHRHRHQTESHQHSSPSVSSRSRSRSPISTRRPSKGSKGRQHDPLRFSPFSRHTRTRHTSNPISSSDTEPPDDLPYSLGLYQSSSSATDSSMVRERTARSSQHYPRRRHRPRQRGTSSGQKKRHRKHPRPFSSSLSTTSTDSESSSEFSTDSSSGRGHRHPSVFTHEVQVE